MGSVLHMETGSAGLKISVEKTKVISPANEMGGCVEIAGNPIEAVEEFTYLGSEVAVRGGTDLDIHSRIEKDRGAIGMLYSAE